MASCQTSRWVSTSPYVKLTVTESGTTTTGTATLSWKLEYIADYPASTSVAKSYTVKIAGATVKEGTYSINGITGTNTIASGTKTITKTKSAQSVSFSVSFAFNLTCSGSYASTKTASGSVSVRAKPSYTVKYDAHGGTGAPSSQTKWYGESLTLSTKRPTQQGHSFQKWSTAIGGNVYYNPGDTYISNSALTLYAVWKADTYTVKYDANGGTGAPGNQTKTYGANLTLSSTKPTRTNYTFKGWGTSASSTTVSYAAGGSYTNNAAITLYAIWELSYVKPRIKNLSIYRCNQDGSENDSGTGAFITFDWECDKTISNITLYFKPPTSTIWTSFSPTVSGTSGHIGQILGYGMMSTESSYDIKISVSDSDGQTTLTKTLASMSIPIDFLSGGKGVAFGKTATISNCFEVQFLSNFRSAIHAYSTIYAYTGIESPNGDLLIETGMAYPTYIQLGSYYNKPKGLNIKWADGTVHNFITNTADGLTSYIGPGDIDVETKTNLRGQIVRLYAHSGGGVYVGYSGSVAVTSDKNLKKDIVDIDEKYEQFFNKLRPITYKYDGKNIKGHRDHIGFIAQEVEEALLDSGLTTENFAGIVIERDVTMNPKYDSNLSDEENKANEEQYDTLYSLRYEEFVALNTRMIQKLNQEIEQMKMELNELRNLLAKMPKEEA